MLGTQQQGCYPAALTKGCRLQEGQSREQKISEITAKLNELKRYHQTLLQKQKAQIVGYEVVIKTPLGYLVVVVLR